MNECENENIRKWLEAVDRRSQKSENIQAVILAKLGLTTEWMPTGNGLIGDIDNIKLAIKEGGIEIKLAIRHERKITRMLVITAIVITSVFSLMAGMLAAGTVGEFLRGFANG